ncbi:MAG: RNA 2',3'-cyclic phosphodiesterase [Geodermatophilaceae bacterium]
MWRRAGRLIEDAHDRRAQRNPVSPQTGQLVDDLRRLSRRLAELPHGAPWARQHGTQIAYDDVLVALCRALGVEHDLETLSMGMTRDMERLRVEDALLCPGSAHPHRRHLKRVRLFVGLFPPAAAVAHLDDALAAIRHGSGLRWQPAERWHVTLAFLGDVEPHGVDDVRADVAADCGSVPALTARLAGAGSFRTGRGGGALWIGVRGDGLAELAARLRSAELTDEEASRFRGHLTVARWRPPERLDDTVVRALGPYNWSIVAARGSCACPQPSRAAATIRADRPMATVACP